MKLSENFKVICTLKGRNHQALPENDFIKIKNMFLEHIEKVSMADYWGDNIKVKFLEEQKIIEFGYEPDEIKCLFDSQEIREIFNRSMGALEKDDPEQKYQLYKFYYYLKDQEISKHIDELYTKHLQQKNLYANKEHTELAEIKNIAEKNSSGKVKNSLEYLIKNFQGCFIGEGHSHISPKKVIINNLSRMNSFGVKKLFSEFLYKESHQKLLDDYWRNDKEELPYELKKWLAHIDKVTKCGKEVWINGKYQPTNTIYTYTNIVKQAKKANIQIIALDSYLLVGQLSDGPKRVPCFNQQAYEIILQESGNDKYVAHMGMSHSFVNKDDENLDFIGLPDLLPNNASLYICDSSFYGTKIISPGFYAQKKQQKHILETDVLIEYPEQKIKFY